MKLKPTQQLGLNIRQYREDKKICQEAIAFQMGISQSTLSRLETGQLTVTPTILQRLALVLQTTPECLETYHQSQQQSSTNGVSMTQLLAQKDQLIASQQTEIAFLRQQLMDTQQLLASCLQGGEDALNESVKLKTASR